MKNQVYLFFRNHGLTFLVDNTRHKRNKINKMLQWSTYFSQFQLPFRFLARRSYVHTDKLSIKIKPRSTRSYIEVTTVRHTEWKKKDKKSVYSFREYWINHREIRVYFCRKKKEKKKGKKWWKGKWFQQFHGVKSKDTHWWVWNRMKITRVTWIQVTQPLENFVTTCNIIKKNERL